MEEAPLAKGVPCFKVQERAVTPPAAPTYRMYALHALTKADMSSESEEKDTVF